MAWPSLALSTKVIDVSKYQNLKSNTADPAPGRIDYVELANEHPEIKLVISRAAGSWSGIDPDFEHNYDESRRAGFLQAPYVNINPAKRASELNDWWERAIDDRDPQLIVLDCETTGGKTRAQITAHIQERLEWLRRTYPNARVIIYTADWWWRPNVAHGWEGQEIVWAAHYVFFVQDPNGKWRQAWSFEESDPFLPISNSFTPRTPLGFAPANVRGWQLSDKMIIHPISKAPRELPRVDGDYFYTAFIDETFKLEPPDEPTPADPVPIEISYPAGQAEIKIVEV